MTTVINHKNVKLLHNKKLASAVILFVLIFGFMTFVFLIKNSTPSFQAVKIFTSAGVRDLSLEMAITDEQKLFGLMHRKKLASDTGMFFLYPNDAHPAMWMKNMIIPLDMVFIGKDQLINHIESNVPPCTEKDDRQCPIYASKDPSRFVLELPAGYCSSHQIEVGDHVSFPAT